MVAMFVDVRAIAIVPVNRHYIRNDLVVVGMLGRPRGTRGAVPMVGRVSLRGSRSFAIAVGRR